MKPRRLHSATILSIVTTSLVIGRMLLDRSLAFVFQSGELRSTVLAPSLPASPGRTRLPERWRGS